MTPRGIRLNNPGNVRLSGVRWQGQVSGTDPEFCQFSSPAYGLRCLMLDVRNYAALRGLDTVRKIISRYAPSSENNTEAYVEDVAHSMNVSPDDKLPMDRNHLIPLAQAVTIHENGEPPAGRPRFWFPDEVYANAFSLLP